MHYVISKNKYGEKSHLFLPDIDSIMYDIETSDLYKAMIEMK